ncbi:MAG: hypothetical protein KI790_08645 [Cyclobacteriaceae bacterium]|nr:hypothetical protein [Cyclobacteriaceae bacterium HetDA_MAG_MS6]
MQDYISLAAKNGITLDDEGPCQFCGALTTGGIHECIEIFSLGFQVIQYANPDNHLHRFMSVDAHTLQHPEIHGRWNNHFHLTRQHLIFRYNVQWTYQLSPRLSDYLNRYKADKSDEFLTPPKIMERGSITTTHIKSQSKNSADCRKWIENWGKEVYQAWDQHHDLVDAIAQGFLAGNQRSIPYRK